MRAATNSRLVFAIRGRGWPVRRRQRSGITSAGLRVIESQGILENTIVSWSHTHKKEVPDSNPRIGQNVCCVT